LRLYYQLTKPGIVKGNLVPAIAGFFLASEVSKFLPAAFVGMIVGLALVIAASCVFNNYIDRDIDRVMKRTKNRALVTGKISPGAALIYASVLLIGGAVILLLLTNALTMLLALFGAFAYVVLYGIGKRKTVHGTVIGSISGAVPPVVGYCALSGRLDLAALILFLILVFWQMPHFYAIAMYRREDYKSAHIPVLPLKNGNRMTQIQIIAYVVLFAVAAISLTLFKYTGYTYLIVMLLVSLAWLMLGARGFKTLDPTKWAKRMFLFSLVVLVLTSIMISIDRWLP
jgi:protoheme IX farnesyltransferase